MSKNISQQAIANAECAAAAAATFSVSLTDAQLVEHAASLQQAGATADLHALVKEHEVTLTTALKRLVPTSTGDLVSSLGAASTQLRRAQNEINAENAFEVTKLSAAGFETVKRTRTDEVTTIFATGAHATFMVQIDHQTGEVVRDWQTGPGDTCVGLDAEWTAGMVARGTRLTTISEDVHSGRRDGERLIQPAKAASPDQPTVGGVLAFRKNKTAPKSGGIRRTAGGTATESGKAVTR